MESSINSVLINNLVIQISLISREQQQLDRGCEEASPDRLRDLIVGLSAFMAAIEHANNAGLADVSKESIDITFARLKLHFSDQ